MILGTRCVNRDFFPGKLLGKLNSDPAVVCDGAAFNCLGTDGAVLQVLPLPTEILGFWRAERSTLCV